MEGILREQTILLQGWLGIQYSGHKDISETDKRMAGTADTANIVETLETGKDAMGEPDEAIGWQD
jgi:hypothetical protein